MFTTLAATLGAANAQEPEPVRNVVLVHGAFADGSGWRDVFERLTEDGYNVVVAQNPITSLADDVVATRRAIASLEGPALLVGHSYGGAVITEVGGDPNVAGLVYVAGFAPDQGESISTLIAQPVEGATPPPILPPSEGAVLLDPVEFPAAFAADVDPSVSAFMARSQVALGLEAYGGEITNAAWRDKPSYYLVATEDRMIPPAAQRTMAERIGATVDEIAASHALYLSQPAAVAEFIERAARGGVE